MTGRMRCIGVVLALTSLAAGVQSVAAEEQAVAAVWKVREINFSYRSSAALLTCDSLKRRVISVLLAIGAREDMDVRVSNCDISDFESGMNAGVNAGMNPGIDRGAWGGSADSGIRNSDPFERSTDPFGRDTRNGLPSSRFGTRPAEPEQSANIRARFVFPSVVTAETITELDNDRARRELISRVTGNPAAKDNNPVIFPARRQLITLSHETIGISPVECQLLEQMSGYFKTIDVKIVNRGRICSRGNALRTQPQMTVESLVGVPLGMGNVPTWPPPNNDKDKDNDKNGGSPSAEPASAPPTQNAPAAPESVPPAEAAGKSAD